MLRDHRWWGWVRAREEKKNKIRKKINEHRKSFPYIPVLVSSSSSSLYGMEGIYKRIKFDFLWFSSRVDSFRKKMLFVYFYKHTNKNTQKMRREEKNKIKFHNIPKRSLAFRVKYINIMHTHSRRNHGMTMWKTGFRVEEEWEKKPERERDKFVTLWKRSFWGFILKHIHNTCAREVAMIKGRRIILFFLVENLNFCLSIF